MTKLRRYLWCGVLLWVLAGCGAQGNAAAPTPTVPAYSNTNAVIVPHPGGPPDSLYLPNPIRVRVGQIVTWTNFDTDPHDVTSDSDVFASGELAQGGKYVWVPRRPGIYHYFCTVHPEMHGTIIVRA